MSCFSPDIHLIEEPNQAASGNGAMTLWFHAPRSRRAVPEQRGSAAPEHYRDNSVKRI
jgi:hypothetical protein